jgi:hypothetical protein
MFTLGNKEAIVNSPAQFPLTPAAATVGAVLNIGGFGTFDPTKIVSAVARRASDAQLEKLELTCPAASVLGILAAEVGVAVVVHLRVNSLRQASESAIDFIKRGRPMILELKLDGTDTNIQVATKVATAFAEYQLKFFNITLPVTAVQTPGTELIVFTATAGWFQINESVTFLKRGDIFAYDAATTKYFIGTTVNDAAIAPGDGALTANPITLTSVVGLAVNDTITFLASPTIERRIIDIVGSGIYFTPALVLAAECVNGQTLSKKTQSVEAINDGKYLEENVRMSTPFTSDAYAINPNQVPVIGAKYAQISFVVDPTNSVGSWQPHTAPGAVANAIPAPRYTLFVQENATTLAGGGYVELLLTWLNWSGNVDVSDFKKANGASATSEANFIA